MKVFFDTEFTGLHKNTTLISLGCVDEDGRSFYAEFTDYDRDQCDDWIKKHVLKNLKFDRGDSIVGQLHSDEVTEIYDDKEHVKEALAEWLSVYDEVQFVSDVCHYDMVLLIDLFGSACDLPKNVSPSCHDINQDIAEHYGCSEREAFDKSREGILADYELEIRGDKHNALYDAKVIKRLYRFVLK